MANLTLDYGYVAYIDEAGDPGLKKVRPFDPEGSSEWLVLSGVLIKANRETDVVGWVDDIRTGIGVKQMRSLHYRDLSPTRKVAVATRIAELPLRGFVVCSNKKNMKNHHNAKAALVPSQEWFYNWMVRILLERITAYCNDRTERDYSERKKIKIEFSKRGGHSYGQTAAYHAYLKLQRQSGKLHLMKREPYTDLLSSDLMLNYPHYLRAGLQLADCVASAFYQASDCLGPGKWNTGPAKALKKIMALENRTRRDFGVVLQPTPPWKAQLTEDQKQIFEYYDYDFQRW